MEDYRVILLDMDTKIKGYMIRNNDGFSTIVLNARHCHEQNIKSYLHELKHMYYGDLDAEEHVTTIEAKRHEIT